MGPIAQSNDALYLQHNSTYLSKTTEVNGHRKMQLCLAFHSYWFQICSKENSICLLRLHEMYHISP